MSLFDPKTICSVCDKETGIGKRKIADKELICNSCYKKAGLKMSDLMNKPINKWTAEDFKEVIAKKDSNIQEISNFTATKKIGTFVEFDDNQKKWLVLSSFLGKRDKSIVYNYSDIVHFELLEDEESVAKGGLGRALVGGALFGGTGAIVGGVTGKRKNKGVCTSMKLKVTINDVNNPAVYINFIETKTKKSGMVYKNISKLAQECLSTFQLICDQNKNDKNTNETSISAADELKKYKELLDMDAISLEEYEAKKTELLKL